MLVKPRNWLPSSAGTSAIIQREVDLRARALEAEASMFSTRSSGSSRGLTSSRNVRRGSSALTRRCRRSTPSRPGAPPRRAAVLGDDRVDRRLEADLGPERLGGPCQYLGEPAVPLLVEGPCTELAVVLTDRVVEQHEPRPLRARADLRPDDARRSQVALQQLGLEVVVEEVGGAAGQQPDGVVEDPLVHLLEARSDVRQRDASPRGRR